MNQGDEKGQEVPFPKSALLQMELEHEGELGCVQVIGLGHRRCHHCEII